MRIGFSTRILLTAFLPVVLLLAGTFVALRIFVDSSVRDRVAQQTALNSPAESAAGTQPVKDRNAQQQSEIKELGASLRAAIERVFTVAALAAFLLIFLVSVVSARSTGHPLTAFVAGLRESEHKGRLVPFPISSRVQEINELAEAFNQAAQSIQESQDKLARAQLHFIEAMASALDARDPYTAGHSQRVADYACSTAKALGLPDAEIDVLRVGALLHDVGKIGVPDGILLKPMPLTLEEMKIVQLHPTVGRQILERIEGFDAYLPIIELHHENHDGTGYPHGLKGNDIPLPTRIVHVVDAFDAMTSDRPYRKGMSPADALAGIEKASGTQFDPKVLTAFLGLRKADRSKAVSPEPRVRDYVQLARGLASTPVPVSREPID